MIYYKDTQDSLYAYEDNVDSKYIKDGLISITEDEYISMITPTDEEVAEANRLKSIAEAKQYLNDTDYKVMSDYDGNTDGILEARAKARATIRGEVK